MHKVSVIVPIYNSKEFLAKCLASIVDQTIENLEVILVNDGSTDGSDIIAKTYKEKYPERVIYLEKENGGLSDARNYGLKYATGDYISFVDSDDFLDISLYKNLEKYMDEDYDMIKFAIIKVNAKGNLIKENPTVKLIEESGEDAFEKLSEKDVMTEVAWAYLYKKSFWDENHFEFTKGRYHEDFGLIPLVLLKAKKVVSTDILGYYYAQTEGSLSRTKDKEKKLKASYDLLYFYDNMIKTLENYDCSKKAKENIKRYYTNCILLEINNIDDEEERKKYIKNIRKRKIIRNIKAKNLKQLVKRIILSLNIEWYLKIRE